MARYDKQIAAHVHNSSHRVQEIKSGIRTQELIDTTFGQTLQAALDQAFPNVEHRQIVEYQGKRYRCRYFPQQKARSGWAVSKWGKHWEPIES